MTKIEMQTMNALINLSKEYIKQNSFIELYGYTNESEMNKCQIILDLATQCANKMHNVVGVSDLRLEKDQRICDVMAESGDCSCAKILPKGDYIVVDICNTTEFQSEFEEALEEFYQFSFPEIECETDDGCSRLLFYKM